MKSKQVANVIPKADQGKYSELQVLRSPAGWYIGTMYNDPEYGQEPGSRDSEYFNSREEAQTALESESWNQRMTP